MIVNMTSREVCQGHVPEPAHHDHRAEHLGQADPGDPVHHHHQEAAPTPGLRGLHHPTKKHVLLNQTNVL